jgi:regulator of sirC expression with transglutaminase-like and TPR domain
MTTALTAVRRATCDVRGFAPHAPRTVVLLLVSLVMSVLFAAEPKREVTAEQAKLLTAVATAEPTAALKQLSEYQGEAHPLITLALAQTYWRLASEAKDDALARTQRAAAEKAYGDALKLDGTLRQAHLGLAQCAAAREDWLTASREAAAGIDPTFADRGEVTFLAHAALRAQDWRLAGIAAQQGIVRFPDDATLRRIEVSVLQHAGRAEDVRQAVLALLAKEPGDAELWRHLAWAAQETRREDEALAALEAAVVLKPDDRALRRALAESQLGRGLPHVALTNLALLVGTPPSAEALADAALMLSASRAAADAGALAQGRAWLAAIPEANRTRPLRLQAARLAVQAGDQPAAAAALDTLIALGEQDASVLAWAGSLAEARGEVARAEALYLKASGAEGASASAASLRLVALYLKQERLEDARSTLATHLAKRPDDQQAKALQAQLDRRVKPR